MLFGVTAKFQVNSELCKPARAVRETPFLLLRAGIGRCAENPPMYLLHVQVSHIPWIKLLFLNPQYECLKRGKLCQGDA